LKILQTLLKTDAPFNFLLELKKEDLEKLVVVVRDRVEGCKLFFSDTCLLTPLAKRGLRGMKPVS
jgi:hypothetical protein